MKKIKTAITAFILFCLLGFMTNGVFAQDDDPPVRQGDDIRIGIEELKKSGANYYNYADPDKVNIEVIVMGGIRNPGKYLIPEGTTLIGLLSLAGNPVDKEIYQNIKLIRPETKNTILSTSQVEVFDYEALFESDIKGKSFSRANPIMMPGDIVVMQIRPDKTFWETIKDVMVIFTPVITIVNLIYTITRINRN